MGTGSSAGRRAGSGCRRDRSHRGNVRRNPALRGAHHRCRAKARTLKDPGDRRAHYAGAALQVGSPFSSKRRRHDRRLCGHSAGSRGAHRCRAVRAHSQAVRARRDLQAGACQGWRAGPGLIVFVPFVDRVHRVSLRIITMPIQSQGIITRDNVSVDVSAVAYYRVADAIRSVVAIENASAAISQIAQTTLRAVVGRHTLDETLSETDKINQNIREILDVQTEEWGIQVTIVELRDIQLPNSMQRAMARQAEAEREKRAKIIAAEGEALAAGELARASDVMTAHPLALQLRNLQPLVEISADKNSTVIFPAPLMSTIQELGSFLNRETSAVGALPSTPVAEPARNGEPAGT